MTAQRRAPTGSGTPEPRLRLERAATEFYDDLRLVPLLRTVLSHSLDLLGSAAGSVSITDPSRGCYTKMAESGAACRLGQSFPLDQGVTGQVVLRRRPVVLERYGDLPSAHLPLGHPARGGAAVAVPIWWRGDVIGANVVFAGSRGGFTAAEVDQLDVLTQSAAAAIVTASVDDPGLAHLRADHGASEHDPVVDGGRTGPPALMSAPVSSLSPREHDVLRLLALGWSDPEVAAALFISRKTVEKHVGAVLRKTGTRSRTAAVVHALRLGWQPDAGGRLAG